MIEEQARVVALEAGAVWVETRRQSTCGGCSANAGCGQGLMDKIGVRASHGHVRALCDLQLQVGDGESWKQMSVLGLGQQTVKSVAPTSAAVDLRLEMNVEPR